MFDSKRGRAPSSVLTTECARRYSSVLAKRRPADRLGVFAIETAGGKALADRPFAVDPPEQRRRRRIERIGRTRLAPHDDAALGRRLVRFDLRAAQNRNVVHEGVGAEIDLVALLRPARMTDAKGVLPKRAVVQLHELRIALTFL